jgi:hypothetical protein
MKRRESASTRNAVADVAIKPTPWPRPTASAASETEKMALEDSEPAKDRQKQRPAARPSIVNPHHGVCG